MHRYRCLLFFWFALVAEVTAQQFLVAARRYGQEDGLPHRQVNGILQDRRGFIWAATNGGVARFDGRRFEVFNASESGLPGDIVDWVAEDPAGNIWACRHEPNGWIYVINPDAGTAVPLSAYLGKFPLPVVPDYLYQPPLPLPDGSLLLSTSHPGGLLRYDPRQGWTTTMLPESRLFVIAGRTDRGTIWGINVEGDAPLGCLLETTLAGEVLRRIYPGPDRFFMLKKGQTGHLNGFFILEAGGDQAPVIWEMDGAGNRNVLACRTPYPFVPQHAHLAGGRIEVQFPFIREAGGRELLDISRQFPEIDPLQYRDYLVDRAGNIWFATTFGIIVVEYRENHFHRLLYQENAAGDRGPACRGLLEKNGRLIVNTETYGVGRFWVDPRTGRAGSISPHLAIGIGESADGNVWTEFSIPGAPWGSASLLKTDPAGQPLGSRLAFTRSNGYIWTILEENPRRVLLGHADGVSVYDPVSGAVQPWHDAQFPDFDIAGVSWMQRDRAGRIWACTNKGFFRLHPGGGVAERLWTGGRGDAYLPYDHVYHFYEDAAGIFWLGTAGGGLIRLDRRAPEGQTSRVIFRKNGLLNGVVYAVYEDGHGHLWMPTDYGIVQLDKTTLQVRRTWLKADGVTHNEFNRVSHCRGADGTLYFGGLNGVTAFHPDDFYAAADTAKQGAPLVVSGFSVLDAGSGRLENRTGDLLRSNRIVLQPSDRYVQLEFALLDYLAPEKATYLWKLDEMAADWETLKEPELRLSGLSPGTHRLRIRAQAADGAQAVNELSFQFDVLPPFYLRAWFLLLVALALAAGVWAWVSWRTRAHRREQERLEAEVARQTATIREQSEELRQLDRAKNRFFANISHELRTPLTLILGPLSSMLKNNQLGRREQALAETAYENGRQLLRLVHEILDLSKLESGKMVVQETPLAPRPFLNRVVGAFESHAQSLGIDFMFDNRVPEDLWALVDAEKWRTVLNNLLANALKFTPPHAGGMVSTTAEVQGDYLRVVVRDTGRGIHPDDLPHIFDRFFQTAQPGAPIEGGVGIGLALCRDLVGLMRGRIGAESTPGRGSSFFVELPLQQVPPAPPESTALSPELPAAGRSSGIASAAPPAAAPRILLVEDNDGMRDFLTRLLSDHYRIDHARHGEEALRRLQEIRPLPDLILSDVMMPVMDGFQLLEVLKADDRLRAIPAVMLTARADLRDKLRALRIGVDDYLLKPFEEEELLARLDNLLAHSRERRAATDDAADHPAAAPVHTREDQEWLQRLEALTAGAVGDSRLGADWLAAHMLAGRSVFYKKVKQLTGMTPNAYIQEVRMAQARYLLETGAFATVKEVARAVGVKDVKYFSEQFRKRYGKLPSAYR